MPLRFDSVADVQSLIDTQVPESVHLDYKASPALAPNKKDEIAKDVSSFANSDGGSLIYGVTEDRATRLPQGLDEGVDPKFNREWLEQVILSNISPRIDGVVIREVRLPSNRLLICIDVPKSNRGPHQAPDHRYYKRFAFQSQPMEHYEIEDVRNRRAIAPPLVNLDLEAPGGYLFEFVLRNNGMVEATQLQFTCAGFLKWQDDKPPSQFSRGIQRLAPGKILHIPYGGVFDLMPDSPGNDPSFRIDLRYRRADTAQIVEDSFHFDLADFRGTSIHEHPTAKAASELARKIQQLIQQATNIAGKLDGFSGLAAASGLNLSRRSIDDLRRSPDAPRAKFSVRGAKYELFQEILDIDISTAHRLAQNFWNRSPLPVEKIEGVTPEIAERFHAAFTL